MTDYTQQIQAELNRLDDLNTRKTQRDKTIRALAQADIEDQSLTAVLGEGGVISSRSYYHKDKDWYHNALFREVLENVIDLYRQRDNAEREALEAEARRKRHEERVALIRAGKGQLAKLLKGMDIHDSSPSQVAAFMKAVFGEERAEFNELPTQGNINLNFDVDVGHLTDEEIDAYLKDL